MFKRVIILLVLSSILIALVLVKDHTSAPVTNTITKSNDSSSGYTTVEYEITKIKGNQYYGKRDDGTVIFSSKNIISGDKIRVHDEVICYFEKNNLGKGLVKVEKK
jgi:hypothetical protein